MTILNFNSPYLAIFRTLDSESKKKLIIREYKEKSPIITANTMGDMNLYLLLDGVGLVQRSVISTSQWINSPYRLVPGDFIGLRELLLPTPLKRRAIVVAKTPVHALQIDGAEFKRWQTTNGQLYNLIIANVLDKQYENRDLLFHCASANTNISGASYLNYLYQIYLEGCYTADYTGPVHIRETHQEIGCAIVKNVRSIDRCIQELQKEGLVSVRKKKLYIDADQSRRLQAYISTRMN